MTSGTSRAQKAARLTSVTALVLGAVLCLAIRGSGPSQAESPAAASPPPGPDAPGKPTAASYCDRPSLYFIENRGQVDKRVKYYVKGSGQTTFFTKDEVVLALRPPDPEAAQDRSRTQFPGKQRHGTSNRKPAVIRLKPVGMHPGVTLSARQETGYRVNYFLGKDPKQWRTDIPTYQSVTYQNAYPGIDITYYGQGRQLEYDIVLGPGADPGQVKFAYQGVRKLELTPEGDLALRLPDGGRLLQKKPLIYQEIAGLKVPVEGKYRLCRQGARLTCGFTLANYDKKLPLVIDPVLVYSTYLGGDAGDLSMGVAVDAAGNAWVAGFTPSTDFPQVYPLPYPRRGGSDVFVARLDAAGVLTWCTYLGGTDSDGADAIVLDESGNAYVAGTTFSSDFPLVNHENLAAGEIFVTKIAAAGNALIWSGRLGGSGACWLSAMAVDQYHRVYLTGGTNSSSLFPSPMTPYYPYHGGHDAFVVRLAEFNTPPDSTLKVRADYPYTYLGGSDYDRGHGIAVDQAGHIYVCGETTSGDFPGYRGGTTLPDAFVTKISHQAGITSIDWSLCLGGDEGDAASSIALDANGHVYITGYTESSSFAGLPVVPLYAYRGQQDAFVAKIRELPTFPSGVLAPLVASFTFLGGRYPDWGGAIAVDSAGCAHVTGATMSADFPVHYPLPAPSSDPTSDVFVTKFNADASALVYSTRLPNSESYSARGLALDADGNVYLSGGTWSEAFPTRVPWQSMKGSFLDAYVTKLSPRAVPILPLPRPLAFYPFDGTGADTLKDASGHGRDATLSGAATTLRGFESQAYSFDGAGSSIQAPLGISPGTYPRLTMGCWARSREAYTDIRFVLTHDEGGYDRSINIDTRGGSTGWSAFCGNGGVRHVLYGGPVVPGKWTFLAAVYDQTAKTVKFYVDNNAVIMTNATLGPGLGSLRFGAYPANWGYFGGDIDNVFVYGTALTDAQIALIRDYGASAILYAPRPGGVIPMLELLLDD